MLISISLKNWRSHGDTVLEFKKGTNLLIGIMGSGKSSVLDAICFALFGTFPSLERRKQSLSDVFRLNENKASVSLSFQWGGGVYTVTRLLEKKKDSVSTDAEISKDSKLVEKGTVAVTKYIEQVLHLDYDLFTRAIYSEQNNIDYFLTLDPRRRKQEMDVLLGLDKFEEARSNCTSLVNRVRANRKSLELKFSKSAVEESQKKQKEIVERLAELRKAELTAISSLEKLADLLKTLESEFAATRKKREEFNRLEKERVRLETILASLRKDLAGKTVSKEELDLLKQSKASFENDKLLRSKEKLALDSEISKENVILGSFDSKLKAYEKDKLELEQLNKKISSLFEGKSKEQINSEHAEISASISKFESEQLFLRSKVMELDDSTKRLKPDMARCPTCGNSMESHTLELLLKEKADELSKTKNDLNSILLQLPALKQKLLSLQNSIRQMELYLSKSEDLSKKLASITVTPEEKLAIEHKLKELYERRKQLSEKEEELSSKLHLLLLSLREKEQLLVKSVDLSNAELEFTKIKEQLHAMLFSEATYEKQQKDLEVARIDFERLQSQKQKLNSDIKNSEELESVIAKELFRLSEIEKEIASLFKLEEELIIYKNALLQTQLSLRSDLVESINAAMNEIWQIFYPYKDFKELKLSATERDYLFEVYDGTWKPLESVASGGERACAALTLRVALAMVLTPNLSWLILDEPTHNLDKEAVELLSRTLQFRVPEVVDQTFVITHEEGLMGSEFASSYKLVRDKGRLESTKVEKI